MSRVGQVLCAAQVLLLLSAATAQGEETTCEDRDDRWQVHGSSCEKMSSMCDDDSYGELVQAWCPVTCGLCGGEQEEVEPKNPDLSTNSSEGSLAENFTLERSEDKALGDLDNRSKFFGNSSNLTAEGNDTCPAQLGDVDNLRSKNVSETLPVEVLTESPLSTKNVSTNVSRVNNSQHRMHNASHREKGMSTGKAILLLEELEESGKDTVDSLPLIASQFDFLGKDAFSLNFLRMEASNGSRSNASEPSNESSDDRSLVSRILDLLSPAAPTKAVEEEEEKACPEGWERVVGDVYGGDQFSGGWRHSADNIEDCAWRCLRQPGCGSFEWSPSQKRCFRNSQTRPTHEVDRQDFMFCRRQPCPSFKTKEACVGPGIASGYYSKEVNMRAGSYCIWSAGNCQAPLACTDHDCFLPDGGLPGMELPSRYTLWISRLGLQATMLAS
eukprot:Skav218731  [mRNA]  locus=scaffold1346:851259:860298:+ [translate_table: standard]